MIQPLLLNSNSVGKNSVFKHNPVTQNKANRSLEKQAYIKSETSSIDDLTLGLLVLSLFLNAHNIDFSKKIPTTQKFGLGTLVLSTGLFLYNCIKKYNLSKEFEKENK